MTAVLVHLAYDPNRIKPGWVAFVIVMALCVATFFLWRSMNTQLGRIRLPEDDKAGRTGGGSGPGSAVDSDQPTPDQPTPDRTAFDEAGSEDAVADDSAADGEGERPIDPSRIRRA